MFRLVTFAVLAALAGAPVSQSVATKPVRPMRVLVHLYFPELGPLEPVPRSAEAALLSIADTIARGDFAAAKTALAGVHPEQYDEAVALLTRGLDVLLRQSRYSPVRGGTVNDVDMSLVDRVLFPPTVPKPIVGGTPGYDAAELARTLRVLQLLAPYSALDAQALARELKQASERKELDAIDAIVVEKLVLGRAALAGKDRITARTRFEEGAQAAASAGRSDSAYLLSLLAADTLTTRLTPSSAGQNTGHLTLGQINVTARLAAFRAVDPSPSDDVQQADARYRAAAVMRAGLHDPRLAFESRVREAYVALLRQQPAAVDLYDAAARDARAAGFLRTADLLRSLHAMLAMNREELGQAVTDLLARGDLGGALGAANVGESVAALYLAGGDNSSGRLRLQMIDDVLWPSPLKRRAVEARAALAVAYGNLGRYDAAATLMREAIGRARELIAGAKTLGDPNSSADSLAVPQNRYALAFAKWSQIAYLETFLGYEQAIFVSSADDAWTGRRRDLTAEINTLRRDVLDLLTDPSSADQSLAEGARKSFDNQRTYFAAEAAIFDNGYAIARLYKGVRGCDDVWAQYLPQRAEARKTGRWVYHLQMDAATFSVFDYCDWRGQLQRDAEAELKTADPIGQFMPVVARGAAPGATPADKAAADHAEQSLMIFFVVGSRLELYSIVDRWSLDLLTFVQQKGPASLVPAATSLRVIALIAQGRPTDGLKVAESLHMGKSVTEASFPSRDLLRAMQQAHAALGRAEESLVEAEQGAVMDDLTTQIKAGVAAGAADTAELAALTSRRASGDKLRLQEITRLSQLSHQAEAPVPLAGMVPSPADIHASLQAVPEHTTVLVYRWEGNQLDVWRASGQQPLRVWRVRPKGLRQAIDDLHAALSSQLGDWATHAKTLYDQLVVPVGDLPDGERLIIVGSVVEQVPFEVLGADPKHLLFASHPITYARTVWAGAVAPTAAQTTSKALVVGLNGSGLSRAEDEARTAGALLPNATVLVGGDQATRDRVMQALPSASWVHFATHGVIGSTKYLSHLALSNGQVVEGWMLFALARQADMVVLSACNTWTEVSGGDREAGGLGAVVLSAGAKRVVVSQWEANDESSADFMKVFYQALGAGKLPVDSALQVARKTVADQNNDPYLYANFMLRTRDLSSALKSVSWR